jgi:hypothetical protein
MEWWMWAALILFLGGTLYTMIAVGMAAGSSDSKNDMAKAITNVTIVNTILMLVLAGTAYFYLDSDPNAQRPYLILVVHMALLFSVISVSITSLQQLNAS